MALDRERFTVKRVTEIITFHRLPDGDTGHEIEYDEGDTEPACLNDALGALEWGCWDSVDCRGDGSIIAYPADRSIDYRTGIEEGKQVIIHADTPENAVRLVDLYDARRKAKDARRAVALPRASFPH
jgi:hypothetical protein